MHKQETVKSFSMVALLSITLLAQSAFAQENGRGERRGPPPEAFEACANIDAGDSCQFSGRRDDILQGTCFLPDKKESLVCKPEKAPGRSGDHSEDH